jgi:hypothetical protein
VVDENELEVAFDMSEKKKGRMVERYPNPLQSDAIPPKHTTHSPASLVADFDFVNHPIFRVADRDQGQISGCGGQAGTARSPKGSIGLSRFSGRVSPGP